MPRPGELTRSRANRMTKTPGGRLVIHRQKFYRAEGKCALSSTRMQLPRESKHGKSRNSSHSSRRPNRPYGGKITSKALRRAIIQKIRE